MEIVGAVVDRVRVVARRLVGAVARHPALSLTLLLALLLVVSAALYAGLGTSQVRRVLFYPEPTSGKLVGEEHYIPRRAGREDSIRAVLEELLLGPSAYDLAPVLPRSVDLRSFSVRDRVAYVDFTADLVIDATTVPLSLDGVVQAVANNLYFNFPRLRGVYLFIHGQIPRLARLDATRLGYSREMVR